MTTLEQKSEGQRFAFFNGLFAGTPLPVTDPKPIDLATLLPSRLIEVALADLEALERTKGYVIDMDTWHEPDGWIEKSCHVCLAGSVMARTLNRPPHEELEPFDFAGGVGAALASLNTLRCGEIDMALADLGLPSAHNFNLPVAFDVADYEADPEKFKADMRALAAMLKEHGL